MANLKKYTFNTKRVLPKFLQKSAEKLVSLNYDWSLVFLIIIISLFGFTILPSSLSRYGEGFQVQLFQQIFFGAWLGGFACLVLSIVHYKTVLKFTPIAVIANLVTLLFLSVFNLWAIINGMSAEAKMNMVDSFSRLPISPYYANAAIRWISLNVGSNSLFQFQPSEFAKLTMLGFFAYHFGSTIDRLKISAKELTFENFKLPLYIFIVFVGTIYIQPDLGTVILIFLILIAGFWSIQVSSKIILSTLLVAGVLAMAAIFFTGYRTSRVNTAWDFYNDPVAACTIRLEQNRQVCSTRNAIISGGIFGKGYGRGEIKNRVSEVNTDAIIAVVGEEFGFFGIFFLSFLYLMLFWRAIRISLTVSDTSGKFIATGVSVWIILQAFFNLMGIVGMIPLKGIPLPFVSQGGSSYLLNMTAIGILINISKDRKVAKKEHPNRSKIK